jgi:hypothetical protein
VLTENGEFPMTAMNRERCGKRENRDNKGILHEKAIAPGAVPARKVGKMKIVESEELAGVAV